MALAFGILGDLLAFGILGDLKNAAPSCAVTAGMWNRTHQDAGDHAMVDRGATDERSLAPRCPASPQYACPPGVPVLRKRMNGQLGWNRTFAHALYSAMATAEVNIPPDLARQFEALGVPVVTHRLARFKDARLREAARLWLAQREAELAEVHEAAERQRAGQRYRRFLALTAAIGVVGWAAAIIVMMR